MPDFTGTSLALSQTGIERAAKALTVAAPEIWTVFTVETSGCGFLPDRRPPILFERHVFSRLTKHAFDDGDISAKDAGGYGARGSHQYDRLTRAIALNRSAALQSASWGLGQIMGENFRMAGFTSVEDMITAMCGSEDQQLAAFTAFLRASKLDTALRGHDWTTFARGYNGPSFRDNKYDDKLNAAFAALSTGTLPDLTLRTAQLYLTYRGFDPGDVDGLAGKHTRSALSDFQRANGLPVTGNVDAATLAALRPA